MYWRPKMVAKTSGIVCPDTDNCILPLNAASPGMLADPSKSWSSQCQRFVPPCSQLVTDKSNTTFAMAPIPFLTHLGEPPKLQIHCCSFFFCRHSTSIIIISPFYSSLLIANLKLPLFLKPKYSRQVATTIKVEKATTAQFVAN